MDELRYEASTLGLERKVGQKEGLIKGREEGKAQAAEMIAATLLSKGMDIMVVSEATGLSIENLQLLDK